jgi:glucosamine kinase
MIVIAEAGGTKTDWRVIQNEVISEFQSAGFNLQTHPIEPYISNLPVELFGMKDIEVVHFYAAGVIPTSSVNDLKSRLQAIFHCDDVMVYPDTLAACRAAYGQSNGWLGLLGTGSGLVRYNGREVTERLPSLGYVVGDEGSGADMGKRLVKAFLRGQLTEIIKDRVS